LGAGGEGKRGWSGARRRSPLGAPTPPPPCSTLYKLLKATCLHCFRFRSAVADADRAALRLALLRAGRAVDAASVGPPPAAAAAKAAADAADGGDAGIDGEGAADAPTRARSPSPPPPPPPPPASASAPPTATTLDAARAATLDFFKRVPASVCATCGCVCPGLKRDGASKLFLKSLDAGRAAANDARGTPVGPRFGDEGEDQAAEHEERALEAAAAAAAASGDAPPAARAARGGGAAAAGLRYLTPAEARSILRRAWAANERLLRELYGRGVGGREAWRAAADQFFLTALAVPPNRLRPPSKLGEATFEHPHNIALAGIVSASAGVAAAASGGAGGGPDVGAGLAAWLALQAAANSLIDSSAPDARPGAVGVRQALEKKEGLLRKHMMGENDREEARRVKRAGRRAHTQTNTPLPPTLPLSPGKRVNYAARSVISPDPCLLPREVGLPPYFACRLSIPERVTEVNAARLRAAVRAGARVHPGALAVADAGGRVVSLVGLAPAKRDALARSLLTEAAAGAPPGGGRVVHRHVVDGDLLLTNRQPTLHRPGLMAHAARILVGERTIRLHYANCAAFNADFDGDEINLHAPQDAAGAAEAAGLVAAPFQYLAPTSGSPVRGLIQDHVVAGASLAARGTVLGRAAAAQLVWAAVAPRRAVETARAGLPPPAILKPVPVWTGKQVISAVLASVAAGRPPVTVDAATKTAGEAWGDAEDSRLRILHGELLTGTLDKAAYGSGSLVHAVHELHGAVAADDLLGALSRLGTAWLEMRGFTCGLADMGLVPAADTAREGLLATAEAAAVAASAAFVAGTAPPPPADPPPPLLDPAPVRTGLALLYRASDGEAGAGHDAAATPALHAIASAVVRACLPAGAAVPFPANNLAMMTGTGAKGSLVNFSQIACLLGQQELEGRRVPRAPSGATLPHFAPHDPGARASGFIGDRFLTGLRPQEYYFHCMAGREGLVDTTVKTARSGYLQRCLGKCMEPVVAAYDGTVRDDADGSVIQFRYGGDGVDPAGAALVSDFKLAAANAPALAAMLGADAALATKGDRRAAKAGLKGARGDEPVEPAPGPPPPSPAFAAALASFLADPAHAPAVAAADADLTAWWAARGAPGTAPTLERVAGLRAARAALAPGEAVGVLAAQSIGEPSTQMTLNTFHMAGRGDANVTMGVPRLRELFMSAARRAATPAMDLPLPPAAPPAAAAALAARLRRVRLAEALDGVRVEEAPADARGGGPAERTYTVTLAVSPPPAADFAAVEAVFLDRFVPALRAAVAAALRKAAAGGAGDVRATAARRSGSPADRAAADASTPPPAPPVKPSKDGEDEDAEADADMEEGRLAWRGGRGGGDRSAAHAAPGDGDAEAGAGDGGDSDSSSSSEGEGDGDGDGEVAGDGAAAAASRADPRSRTVTVVLRVPPSAPRLLMLALVEAVAAATTLHAVPGVDRAVVAAPPRAACGSARPPLVVQADGVNLHGAFAACLEAGVPDAAAGVTTNCVGSAMAALGVEAGRAVLTREAATLFAAYGIAVDARHIALLADFMTHQGGHRPCTRAGVASSASPLLRASFETAAHFLADATLAREPDTLRSPAARIAVGAPVRVGAGVADVLVRL